MISDIHITDAVAQMLCVFGDRPGEELRARDVADSTGFSVGHVRRSLRELERAGWLTARDEFADTPRGFASRLHYRLCPALAPQRRPL